jgi:WD40 repeat protein
MAPLYKAFMSYSHSADDKIAPALQRGIQRLGKPWYRPPVVRVFRDETSLSANPGLWSGIERALERCEYFLLLASVSSAASPWVQKEVAWWLEHRSVDRFFVVVTDGEITWNSTADDFDWKRTTCLPPLLRGRFRGEPRYVDLRWATGRKILSLRNSRFRAAVVTLAAPLHGRSMEELDGEDTRQRRRFWMTAGAAVAVIGLLAIASAVERRSAQDESRKAESRSMAAKSVELLGQKGGIDKAILLAVLAWRLSPTDEARSALETLGSASFDVAKILRQHTSNGIESLAFSQTGAALLLATGGGDGLIMLWRIPAGTAAGPPIASGQKYVEELQFSDSGSYLLSRGASPEPSEGTKQDSIVLHDLKSGTMKLVPTEPVFGKQYSWEGAMSVSPDGQLVAFFFGNKLAIWNAATNTVRQKVVGGGEYLIGVYFATNSRLVFVLGPYGYGFHSGFGAGTWDLENDQMRFGPLLNSLGVDRGSRAVFSKDGSRIATWGFNGGHVLLYASHEDMSLQPMQLPGKVRMQGDIRLSVSFDVQGKRIAAGGEEKVAAWDLAEQKVLKDIAAFDAENPVAMSPDGRWLATRDRGNVVVWDLDQHDSQTPGKTLEVACDLSGTNEGECIHRLCEKVSPLINDKDLRDALGNYDSEELKKTALSRPCALP